MKSIQVLWSGYFQSAIVAPLLQKYKSVDNLYWTTCSFIFMFLKQNVLSFPRIYAVTLNTNASCSSASQTWWICTTLSLNSHSFPKRFQFRMYFYLKFKLQCLYSAKKLLWPAWSLVCCLMCLRTETGRK